MGGPAIFSLDTVWQVTLVLLAVSLAIFFALLVIRFFADAREGLLAQRQKTMETALIIHLSTPLKNLSATLVNSKKDFPVLMEAASRLLRVQRGESQTQLLRALMETGLYPWLLRQLKNGSPARRIKAISLLVYWPTDEVGRALLRTLHGTNFTVSLAALEGLAEIGDQRYHADIVAFVLAYQQIKENIIYDVFKRSGSPLLPSLMQLSSNREIRVPVRLAAILALGESAEPQAIESAILPLCRDGDAQIRAAACLIVQRAGLSVPEELLTQLYSDADWRVRQQAAALLVQVEPTPVEKIVRLLGDDNWLVALSVARALQSLGDNGRRLLSMLARTQSVAGQRARQFLHEGNV